MKHLPRTTAIIAGIAIVAAVAVYAYQANLISSSHLINPDELVKILQSAKPGEPLILQVGPHILYLQAHIPGAEYIGSASDPQGLQRLRTRVQSLPRNKFIIIYCGCCPWNHCPNAKPADDALRKMGFTNVKVLHIAQNFGANWVDRGYPTVKGD
jgi:thiosulfate/3-mercaptopyruvate sulfurtransferase